MSRFRAVGAGTKSSLPAPTPPSTRPRAAPPPTSSTLSSSSPTSTSTSSLARDQLIQSWIDRHETAICYGCQDIFLITHDSFVGDSTTLALCPQCHIKRAPLAKKVASHSIESVDDLLFKTKQAVAKSWNPHTKRLYLSVWRSYLCFMDELWRTRPEVIADEMPIAKRNDQTTWIPSTYIIAYFMIKSIKHGDAFSSVKVRFETLIVMVQKMCLKPKITEPDGYTWRTANLYASNDLKPISDKHGTSREFFATLKETFELRDSVSSPPFMPRDELYMFLVMLGAGHFKPDGMDEQTYITLSLLCNTGARIGEMMQVINSDVEFRWIADSRDPATLHNFDSDFFPPSPCDNHSLLSPHLDPHDDQKRDVTADFTAAQHLRKIQTNKDAPSYLIMRIKIPLSKADGSGRVVIKTIQTDIGTGEQDWATSGAWWVYTLFARRGLLDLPKNEDESEQEYLIRCIDHRAIHKLEYNGDDYDGTNYLILPGTKKNRPIAMEDHIPILGCMAGMPNLTSHGCRRAYVTIGVLLILQKHNGKIPDTELSHLATTTGHKSIQPGSPFRLYIDMLINDYISARHVPNPALLYQPVISQFTNRRQPYIILDHDDPKYQDELGLVLSQNIINGRQRYEKFMDGVLNTEVDLSNPIAKNDEVEADADANTAIDEAAAPAVQASASASITPSKITVREVVELSCDIETTHVKKLRKDKIRNSAIKLEIASSHADLPQLKKHGTKIQGRQKREVDMFNKGYYNKTLARARRDMKKSPTNLFLLKSEREKSGSVLTDEDLIAKDIADVRPVCDGINVIRSSRLANTKSISLSHRAARLICEPYAQKLNPTEYSRLAAKRHTKKQAFLKHRNKGKNKNAAQKKQQVTQQDIELTPPDFLPLINEIVTSQQPTATTTTTTVQDQDQDEKEPDMVDDIIDIDQENLNSSPHVDEMMKEAVVILDESLSRDNSVVDLGEDSLDGVENIIASDSKQDSDQVMQSHQYQDQDDLLNDIVKPSVPSKSHINPMLSVTIPSSSSSSKPKPIVRTIQKTHHIDLDLIDDDVDWDDHTLNLANTIAAATIPISTPTSISISTSPTGTSTSYITPTSTPASTPVSTPVSIASAMNFDVPWNQDDHFDETYEDPTTITSAPAAAPTSTSTSPSSATNVVVSTPAISASEILIQKQICYLLGKREFRAGTGTGTGAGAATGTDASDAKHDDDHEIDVGVPSIKAVACEYHPAAADIDAVNARTRSKGSRKAPVKKRKSTDTAADAGDSGSKRARGSGKAPNTGTTKRTSTSRASSQRGRRKKSKR